MPVSTLHRPSHRRALVVGLLSLLLFAPPLLAWNSFIGGAHKPITKVALSWLVGFEFPDMVRRKGDIVDGANSEKGHPNMAHNGGRPADLWYGTGTETDGGVLGAYTQFEFHHAYEKLGMICHLTQDQAVPAHAANIHHGPFKADMLEFFVTGSEVNGTPPQKDVRTDALDTPSYEGILDLALDFDLELSAELTRDLEPAPADVGIHVGASMSDLLQVLVKARLDSSFASADDDSLPPYAYYQAVQDDTRSRLPGLVRPTTGHPYWLAAADAPPLGQDVTYGPQGRHGLDGNCYCFREGSTSPFPPSEGPTTWITLSPEIWKKQVSVAAAATTRILRSASKKLPPLVKDLSVPAAAVTAGDSVPVSFTVVENRLPDVRWVILVLRDGALVDVLAQGDAACSPGAGEGGLLGARVQTRVVIDSETMPPGNYVLDVRLTDGDGNTTPDSVNGDDVTENDTLAPLTVK